MPYRNSGNHDATAGRRLTTVGDSRPLALVVLDAEFRCRVYRKLDPDWDGVGLEDAGRPGMPFRDVVGAALFQELEPSLRQALAGQPHSIEILATSELTRGRALRVLCTPQFDAQGEVDAVQALLLDITRRRQQEAMARLREQQFFEAQRLGRVGHWRRDTAGAEFEISEEHYRILGLEPGRPIAFADYLALIHPDDRQATERARCAAVRSRRGYDFAHRIVRPDGEVRWLEGRSDPLFDEHGAIAGFFGVTQDVTEQHAAEQARRQFLGAIEHIAEGIALYDADDRLVFCNAAYRYVRGHGHVTLEPGIDFAEVLRRRHAAAYGCEPGADFEAYLAQRQAYRRNPAGPFDVHRGATWYRIAESRLGDGSLVSTVADVTRQLDYERQARVAQHVEALGRIAGGIAHEFNNLLTAIGTNLDLLRIRLPSESAARAVVDRAHRAVDRGGALSQQMLAYGRQLFLRPARLDLNRFVRDRLQGLRERAGEAIAVDADLAANLAPCLVDSEQLLSALRHLLDNARDAMPGGGRIRIATANRPAGTPETRHLPADRDYVVLALADDGTGIRPELLDRIVEPFFTTKDVGEGTGLGLSMVQGFVIQSGGDIAIESAPGRGTTVRLYLPAANA